jgi:hypothetical protein
LPVDLRDQVLLLRPANELARGGEVILPDLLGLRQRIVECASRAAATTAIKASVHRHAGPQRRARPSHQAENDLNQTSIAGGSATDVPPSLDDHGLDSALVAGSR